MTTKRENFKKLVLLLHRMWLIRAFEEKVSALYAAREIVGLLHLEIGQEAVAVGICGLLRADDQVFGGHRSHGHALAKGADINRLMAEIAGHGLLRRQGRLDAHRRRGRRLHYGDWSCRRHDSSRPRCGFRS